jgi:hypothetical protein
MGKQFSPFVIEPLTVNIFVFPLNVEVKYVSKSNLPLYFMMHQNILGRVEPVKYISLGCISRRCFVKVANIIK